MMNLYDYPRARGPLWGILEQTRAPLVYLLTLETLFRSAGRFNNGARPLPRAASQNDTRVCHLVGTEQRKRVRRRRLARPRRI